ncbi:MAG TPA: LysR family transcriptional regulator [Polyangiaceae bacterium]|nr:LysR family transcriptional regulator [Polyangiaceae bacterium]
MQDPIETSELLAFVKTVETHSLSRAAAELGVPRATISRRLARLEERLGARLLRRTTRSLVLTDAGEMLHRHARIVLDAVAQAEGSVRQADPVVRGALRVSAPSLINEAFVDMVADFVRSHPAVQLHLHISSQHVDLRRGGHDVALRASSELEPGLVARTLMRTTLIAVAGPSYLKQYGAPKNGDDLANHRCLVGFARGELPQTHWPLVRGGKLPVEGAFFTNELPVLLDFALRGLGIALIPVNVAQPYLDSGELVHVLSGEVGAESRFSIVYPEREFVPPQLRAFIDAVVAWRRVGEAISPPRVGGGSAKRKKRNVKNPKPQPRRGTGS